MKEKSNGGEESSLGWHSLRQCSEKTLDGSDSRAQSQSTRPRSLLTRVWGLSETSSWQSQKMRLNWLGPEMELVPLPGVLTFSLPLILDLDQLWMQNSEWKALWVYFALSLHGPWKVLYIVSIKGLEKFLKITLHIQLETGMWGIKCEMKLSMTIMEDLKEVLWRKSLTGGSAMPCLMTAFICIWGQRLPAKRPCTPRRLETKKTGSEVWEDVAVTINTVLWLR